MSSVILSQTQISIYISSHSLVIINSLCDNGIKINSTTFLILSEHFITKLLKTKAGSNTRSVFAFKIPAYLAFLARKPYILIQ